MYQSKNYKRHIHRIEISEKWQATYDIFLINHYYIKLLRINNYSLSFGSDKRISKGCIIIYSTKSVEIQQEQGSHGLRKGLI